MAVFITKSGDYLASDDGDGPLPPVGTLLAFEAQRFRKDEYWDYRRTGKPTYRVWVVSGYLAVFPALGPRSARSADSPEIVPSHGCGSPDYYITCEPVKESTAERRDFRALLKNLQ